MEGRSSGEAFVEFTSAEEADKALGKHRQDMAHRSVGRVGASDGTTCH